MYKCLNCGALFVEPDTIHTTYEKYYGVDGQFAYNTPLELHCCPNCGDEDIEEYEEEEEN